MRSRSRLACAPTPAKPEPTKNCGALVGLLHDFDYEKYPSLEDHPYKGSEILKERGYSEEVRRAILSHAEYTGVARLSPMEKTLFACDELTGFITACALVKPGKSLAEVEAPSVRKKMKDKAFARSVHREDIIEGAADLGIGSGSAHRLLHRSHESDCTRTGAGWVGGRLWVVGQFEIDIPPAAEKPTLKTD
jgi:hypothetical protein